MSSSELPMHVQQRKAFLRIFALLLASEFVTVLITMSLLGRGAAFWNEKRIARYAAALPGVAAQFPWSELRQIRKGDNDKVALYLECATRLASCEKQLFPKGGGMLNIVTVENNKCVELLCPVAGDDGQRPGDDEGPVDQWAADALAGKLSYSAEPYIADSGAANLAADVPIKDDQGNVKAVLALDVDTALSQDIDDLVHRAYLTAIVPAILVSAAGAAFLASRLVDPIELVRRISSARSPEPLASQPIESPPVIERDTTPQAPAVLAPFAASNEEAVAQPSAPSAPVQGASESTSPVEGDPLKVLTPRERQVLMCVGRGRRSKEIAEELSITEETVKKHLRNISQKLGVHGRYALTLLAIENGALQAR